MYIISHSEIKVKCFFKIGGNFLPPHDFKLNIRLILTNTYTDNIITAGAIPRIAMPNNAAINVLIKVSLTSSYFLAMCMIVFIVLLQLKYITLPLGFRCHQSLVLNKLFFL